MRAAPRRGVRPDNLLNRTTDFDSAVATIIAVDLKRGSLGTPERPVTQDLPWRRSRLVRIGTDLQPWPA